MNAFYEFKSRLSRMITWALPFSLVAQPKITVEVNRPGAKISPTMYGVFFEDINFGADGGLHPELVKNRSFEFDKPLRGWRLQRKSPEQGNVLILRDEENPRNPRYVRLTIQQAGEDFGLSNEGFRGMGIRKGAVYRFSVDARQVDGEVAALRAQVVGDDGKTLAEGRLAGFTDSWQTFQMELTASATEAKAGLNIWLEGAGTLDLDMISLFPQNTWKGRKNGLRPDLVQLLADMKPGFLRFPGGCIVEGFNLEQRYKWKDTIGSLSQRVSNINRWNYEFGHRPTPDYFQSYGLGYFEYFQLAEDLGAEPMPILSCGMACQFNTAEVAPMNQLDPYVQDALDLIEFANAPAKSKWGKIRAEMGHLQPFHLKFLGIGNEQWGPQYVERYKVFAEAIKQYAAQSVGDASPENRNSWKTALYEAAFMTGVERNADLVTLSCYAPLFGHEEAWQWRPNLIWFDNLQSYGTANYYVQKLFSLHRGDRRLAAKIENAPAIDASKQGLHASATLDEKSGEVIIKVVNITEGAVAATIALNGMNTVGKSAKVILLQSDALDAENSLQEPIKIYPQESTVIFSTPNFTYEFQSLSLTILRVGVE